LQVFKNHIGFHPAHVLKKWGTMKKRDYVFHWDDAGLWLHNLDFQDKFVKSIGKSMQVMRTKFACVLFTCIDKADIITKIRSHRATTVIDITKHMNSLNGPPSHKYRRLATAYKYWESKLGKKGFEYQWEDPFVCYMPDKFYAWYKPLRDSYANMALRGMRSELKKKKDIMNLIDSVEM